MRPRIMYSQDKTLPLDLFSEMKNLEMYPRAS